MNTPIGEIKVIATDQGILSIGFLSFSVAETGNFFTNLAISQLREYFEGRRQEFDLPLLFRGTPFQNSIWEALWQIPLGTTRTYQEVATSAGNPQAVRAAAAANGANPFAIVLPCHRVIGKRGALTGYAGGLIRKKWLLEHERDIRFGKQGMIFAFSEENSNRGEN